MSSSLDLLREYINFISDNKCLPKYDNVKLWDFGLQLVALFNNKKLRIDDKEIIYNNFKLFLQISHKSIQEEWLDLLTYKSPNICIVCGNHATYNFSKWISWGTHCIDHKTDEMVNIKSQPTHLAITQTTNYTTLETKHTSNLFIESSKPEDCYILPKCTHNDKNSLFRLINPEKLIWTVIN